MSKRMKEALASLFLGAFLVVCGHGLLDWRFWGLVVACIIYTRLICGQGIITKKRSKELFVLFSDKDREPFIYLDWHDEYIYRMNIFKSDMKMNIGYVQKATLTWEE